MDGMGNERRGKQALMFGSKFVRSTLGRGKVGATEIRRASGASTRAPVPPDSLLTSSSDDD